MKRKSKRGDYDLEFGGEYPLSAEDRAKANAMIAEADTELSETRVNFRWQREPLELVKKVANAMGIPYQTYMKQVLFKQAVHDYNEMITFKTNSDHEKPIAKAQ